MADSSKRERKAGAGPNERAAKRTRADTDISDDDDDDDAWTRRLGEKLASPGPPPGGVPGLVLLPDFVTPAEERELLREIDAGEWDDSTLARRVQHHGWRYNYKARKATAADRLGPLPPWVMRPAGSRLEALGLLPGDREALQVIVNEYRPGQGISAHVDQPRVFGATVCALSLGHAVPMRFAAADKSRAVDVWLPRRSLVIMAGEARYKYKHSIAPRRSDPPPGGGPKTPRRRRVSVTFRSMRLAQGPFTAGAT